MFYYPIRTILIAHIYYGCVLFKRANLTTRQDFGQPAGCGINYCKIFKTVRLYSNIICYIMHLLLPSDPVLNVLKAYIHYSHIWHLYMVYIWGIFNNKNWDQEVDRIFSSFGQISGAILKSWNIYTYSTPLVYIPVQLYSARFFFNRNEQQTTNLYIKNWITICWKILDHDNPGDKELLCT